MNIQNIFQKSVNRKKFFSSLGAGLAGYFVVKSLPLRFLGKRIFNDKNESEKVSVKINPFAVSRQKIGGNNGGK